MYFERYSAALVGAALICSCTVREERAGCPCYLTLDLNCVNCELLLEGGNDVLTGAATTSAGICHSAGFRTLDCIGETWSFAVPREKLWLCVWSECDGFYGTDVSIPVGKECPQVWMSRGEVDCVAEEVRDTVILHKRWCTVRVSLSAAGSAYSRAVDVSSNSSGYDSQGFPMAGDFYCTPAVVDDSCSFKIPQQISNDLCLRILTCASGDNVVSVRSFQLGKYLDDSGYDWEAEDLADVDVAVNFITSTLSLSFEGTRHTHRIELRI